MMIFHSPHVIVILVLLIQRNRVFLPFPDLRGVLDWLPLIILIKTDDQCDGAASPSHSHAFGVDSEVDGRWNATFWLRSRMLIPVAGPLNSSTCINLADVSMFGMSLRLMPAIDITMPSLTNSRSGGSFCALCRALCRACHHRQQLSLLFWTILRNAESNLWPNISTLHLFALCAFIWRMQCRIIGINSALFFRNNFL